MVLVVAQRQMENCLQSVVRNLHLLRRNVLGARMQGKGSAGQRRWLPGLRQNFIRLTAAICTKQTNFKCVRTVPQWKACRPEMCLVYNSVSIFILASGCEIQLSSHFGRFWGFCFHLFLRNLSSFPVSRNLS